MQNEYIKLYEKGQSISKMECSNYRDDALDDLKEAIEGKGCDDDSVMLFEIGMNPYKMQYVLIGFERYMDILIETCTNKDSRNSYYKKFAVDDLVKLGILSGLPVERSTAEKYN